MKKLGFIFMVLIFCFILLVIHFYYESATKVSFHNGLENLKTGPLPKIVPEVLSWLMPLEKENSASLMSSLCSSDFSAQANRDWGN